jgi:hypothetical protein
MAWLPSNHHKLKQVDIKTNEGAEVKLHAFLISTPDVSDQLHDPSTIPPRKGPLDRRLSGSTVMSRVIKNN